MNNSSLKTAIRSFRRKPLIPLLNMFGLSLGIACFLTISLYVYQENTYDTAFTDHEDIYRVESHFLSMGPLAWSSNNMVHALEEFPQVQYNTRVNSFDGNFKLTVNENKLTLNHVLGADSVFFKVFDYKFLIGNSESALNGPNKAVLSETTAKKIFGRIDVIGETIETKSYGEFIVSGVVADPVLKSHLDFDMVVYRKRQKFIPRGWFGVGGYSYAKLLPGVTQEEFDAALMSMTEEKVFPVIYENGLKGEDPMSFEEWSQSANRLTFYAKPIRDIYLNSHLQFEIGANGDRQTRVTLSIVGVFILIIAVINFMNLSTSRASGRAKEVGVKKVLGAGKNRLIRQFLWQSVLFTLIAAIIGGGLSELFVRIINQQLGDVITVPLMSQANLVIGTLIGLVLLGLIAGAYPPFYLSAVKSIPLLKGKSISQTLNVKSAIGFRNALVVFQFVISSALIAASVIVFQQMKHLQSMELGYNKDRVIVIENVSELKKNKQAFRNALLNDPNVNKTSLTSRVPADGSNSTLSVLTDPETTITFGQFLSDYNFSQTIGLELVEGEYFKESDMLTDSIILVNESTVRAMGLEDPVGKFFGNYYRIKGVVKDFHFANVRDEIGPAVIFNAGKSYGRMAISLNSDTYSIEDLNEQWQQFTDEPMEAYFLDQKYEMQLDKERQSTDAVLVFTVLAIIIASLGLFGLATFSAEQRKHEFGIRRVLGANLEQILSLFSLHFLRLIVLAFVISIPLAYFGLSKWLDGFAYRIDINFTVFLIAGVLAMLVAGITLAFQSFKISSVNPVDTLMDD